ncbi:MAG: DUF2752 domain-containing protein [Flavisolibacter sp.]|nr:DUF2752 domain-containing protein [Flavisolibacter sp.]
MSEGPGVCIFKNAGIRSCPGCGIGRSIHEALHFNFAASFEHHALGMPATIVLILYIVRSYIKSTKNYYNGSETVYDAPGSAT